MVTVAGENNIIQAFPRRILDPRRPKRKPTSEEQEEWLFQYDPVIPDDPKRVLSHSYQVLQISACYPSLAPADIFFIRLRERGRSLRVLRYSNPPH